MTTTLTLTPEPDVGSVLIEITSAPAGPMAITRSDANGVAPVRLLPDQEPIGGSLTVRDYEAVLTGSVQYEIVGDSGTLTQSVVVGSTVPVLSAVVLPHLRQSLVAVTDYASRRESGGSVHHVEGREDAIVITKPMRLREGTITVYAATYEDAHALGAIAAPGEVLMLRQPTYTGMDMYLIARSAGNSPQQADTVPRRWAVDIDYVEQRSPSGDLLSAAGWNFAEHTALGVTFAQSTALFPTFNDRVAGP